MLERYVVHVTKTCNMECFYCYEKDKTSQYSEEEIIELVQNIAKNCHDSTFGIEFLGGEPLLAFNNIVAAYNTLETQFPNRVNDYVITTNGTILTNEIKKFLLEHSNVLYAVSMDGTKWSNQFRRINGKNSFDTVIQNLKWAIQYLPSTQVSTHIVTHPFNVGNLFNSVKFLYDLGVRNIGIGTVESTIPIDLQYCNRFVEEMLLVSQSIKTLNFIDLNIDILSYVKPKSDVRTYIYDKDHTKVIGESYGRSKNDLTHTDIYQSVPTDSAISDIIYDLRKCVYDNHQVIMQGSEDY